MGLHQQCANQFASKPAVMKVFDFQDSLKTPVYQSGSEDCRSIELPASRKSAQNRNQDNVQGSRNVTVTDVLLPNAALYFYAGSVAFVPCRPVLARPSRSVKAVGVVLYVSCVFYALCTKATCVGFPTLHIYITYTSQVQRAYLNQKSKAEVEIQTWRIFFPDKTTSVTTVENNCVTTNSWVKHLIKNILEPQNQDLSPIVSNDWLVVYIGVGLYIYSYICIYIVYIVGQEFFLLM